MGKVRETDPVKLLIGLITAHSTLLEEAHKHLEEKWGVIDCVSEIMAFNYTRYYEKEMGTPLYRQFISFQRLIHPGLLAQAKIFTNRLEDELSIDGKRQVNIDPGYLTPAKLVLATTKDHAHRIYLSDGIYAEVTLVYSRRCYRALPWTYPDYRSDTYGNFFLRVREICMRQGKIVHK